MADNFPPNISGDAFFRVIIGQESSYVLTVEDPEDDFILTIQGRAPDNSTLQRVEENEFIFRWNLHQLTSQPLIFIANDTRGAVSTFEPTVEVCACVNEGICTRDGLITGNSTIIMNCQCSEGVILLYILSDVHEVRYSHVFCLSSIQWRVL